MVEGWYYLHINGELIYKRNIDNGILADMQESDFVRAIWSVDSTDRENAWNILVEALSLGAKQEKVRELALKWNCNNTDADVYAERIGCIIGTDGNSFTATKKDFINLQDSPCGFGNTKLEAMSDLCNKLGFNPSKVWPTTFKNLLKE